MKYQIEHGGTWNCDGIIKGIALAWHLLLVYHAQGDIILMGRLLNPHVIKNGAQTQSPPPPPPHTSNSKQPNGRSTTPDNVRRAGRRQSKSTNNSSGSGNCTDPASSWTERTRQATGSSGTTGAAATSRPIPGEPSNPQTNSPIQPHPRTTKIRRQHPQLAVDHLNPPILHKAPHLS